MKSIIHGIVSLTLLSTLAGNVRAGLFFFTEFDHPNGRGMAVEGIDGNNTAGSYRDFAGVERSRLFDVTSFADVDHPNDGSPLGVRGIEGGNVAEPFSDSSGREHGPFHDDTTFKNIDFLNAIETMAPSLDGSEFGGSDRGRDMALEVAERWHENGLEEAYLQEDVLRATGLTVGEYHELESQQRKLLFLTLLIYAVVVLTALAVWAWQSRRLSGRRLQAHRVRQ